MVAPATAYDAKGLLKSAVRDDNPVLIFEHKLLYGTKGARSEKGALSPVGEVPDEDYLVPIGKGIIRREGKDVTIVGKLLTVYRALAAAEELAKEGIEAEVIDPRTLVPLDKELILDSVRKTGRLVIVEEDNLTGGWAGEIAAIVAEEAFYYLDAPIKRVSAPDTPPPFAPVMEAFYVPSEERIVQAVSVGLSTSRLIANVSLAELDEFISANLFHCIMVVMLMISCSYLRIRKISPTLRMFGITLSRDRMVSCNHGDQKEGERYPQLDLHQHILRKVV